MVMVTGAAARCWKNAFHAFGSANFFWGRTQTPRLDFTTSVLAGSGSARHGTVCPPKPKILAMPLIAAPATLAFELRTVSAAGS